MYLFCSCWNKKKCCLFSQGPNRQWGKSGFAALPILAHRIRPLLWVFGLCYITVAGTLQCMCSLMPRTRQGYVHVASALWWHFDVEASRTPPCLCIITLSCHTGASWSHITYTCSRCILNETPQSSVPSHQSSFTLQPISNLSTQLGPAGHQHRPHACA